MCRMNTFMSDPNSAWKDLGKPPSHKSGARYPDAVYSGGRNEFVFAVSLTCLMYILYSQVITCPVDIWL